MSATLASWKSSDYTACIRSVAATQPLTLQHVPTEISDDTKKYELELAATDCGHCSVVAIDHVE